MDKNAKLFIKASIIYLGLGVFMGFHLAVFEHARAELRFVHVHMMLLGFLSMMIYGVAYHILPRFNARPVPYPALIPVHFWLANIGLWTMSAFYIMGGYWTGGMPRALFGAAGALEGIAIFIFIVNIWGVLKEEDAPAEAEKFPVTPTPSPTTPTAPSGGEPVKVGPSMKIGDILDKWPHLEEIFNQHGLDSVANPSARATVGKMITLEMAAKKAGVGLFNLIAALEGKKLVTGSDEDAQAPAHPQGYLKLGAQIERGSLAHAKTQIGNLLEVYPEVKPVFESNYGSACFTCPGQKTETVEQTAMMHNMPVEKILDEINGIIQNVI
ncbi:MAG: DUF1858 domain-containing protein [Nitrospinae bacterium]|nr:DUF1858 domain-containing protein [Nitrospinota bacterium]